MPWLVLLGLVTWSGALIVGARRPGPDLEPFLRRAFPGASLSEIAPGVVAATRAGSLLGHATIGRGDGYSGPITLAVASGPDGRLLALAILEHHDTPVILRSGLPLLRSLLGRGADDGFEVGRDVDAVTGATHTSRGLALASLEAARALAARAPSRAAAAEGLRFGFPEVVLLGLVVVGGAAQNRPWLRSRQRRPLRALALGTSLVTLGFLFAQPWALAFPIRLLLADVPSWRTHLYWYVLLCATLLAFSRAGKSPYCGWLCPFGAAQDALGVATGGIRRRAPRPRLFLGLKAGLLWLAVLLGLLYRNPAAASYEVFGAAFRWRGSGPQLALLVVVGLAALVVRRPFCHYACPIDAIERPLRALRRSLAGRGVGVQAWPPADAARPASAEVPVFRRLRQGVLVGAGLLAVALALAHLLTTVPAGAVAAPGELLADAYVSLDGARP